MIFHALCFLFFFSFKFLYPIKIKFYNFFRILINNILNVVENLFLILLQMSLAKKNLNVIFENN